MAKKRPRTKKTPEVESTTTRADEDRELRPLLALTRLTLGWPFRVLWWLANLSVHLTLGVAAIAGAVIFLAIAADEPSPFVWQFAATLVVVGLAMGAWGFSRLRSPNPPPSRLDELAPARFFLETWSRIDEMAREERLAHRKAGLGRDYRPLVALCLGAICLSAMEYFGGSRSLDKVVLWSLSNDFLGFAGWVDASFNPADEGDVLYQTLVDDPEALMVLVRHWEWWSLSGFAWWSGWRVLGYFLLPCAAVWLAGQRIRDQGLATQGFSQHAWIYGVAFCIVLVCVVIVSYTDEFSEYYPFYKLATRSWADFVAWELLYAAQFFSLEFFFRGWWLKNLERMMGSHAVFAMVVPYCMIHFGKPFPETIAAIVAGLVLGTLAMKTRSIWSGFLIHVSVAVSMDMAALAQTTGLPDHLWPVGL
jgi:membrane protease YdiL (CAAX protease family)